MTASRRRRSIFGRKAGRWSLGLFVVILCALMLWFGLRWDRDAADMADATAPSVATDLVPPVDEGADATAPAAGGDMVPPAEDDSDTSPPLPQPDRNTTDVIPPEEP
jgi:hypothetical protein